MLSAMVLLSTLLRFWQEFRSNKAAEELKATGGADAGAVAHALAQKGDMTVWQYNVHRGANGALQFAPTAKIGLIANSSLRVEPYTTPYTIVPHD